MRLRTNLICFLLLVYFSFSDICNAQDQEAFKGDTTTQQLKPVTILFERAQNMNPENNWFPALIEAALEFKFDAINSLIMTDPEVVSRAVIGHKDLKLLPKDMEYIRAAQKLSVNYVVKQTCEVTRAGAVQYYAEIISVSDESLYKTVEKSFKLENFGAAIDELVGLYMRELNVAQQKEFSRFLNLPSVGTNTKMIKTLGELITRERYMTDVDASQLANDYRILCEKDRSFLLAYYRAGLFFETVGRLADASEALNILFMTIPEYQPIYVPLARVFRKNNRFDAVVRIVEQGKKRGITSPELSSELILAYTAMGKKSEADAVFTSELKNNTNDPFALLFSARKHNNEGNAEEALTLGDRLLQFNSDRGWAQVERGRSLTALGRNDEAITAFNEAISLLPNETDPILNLGNLYKVTNQYQNALQHYEKILKRAPDNIELYRNAAEMATKAGDLKKALSLLYSIEPRFLNNSTLQAEIGLLELDIGDSSRAKEHLKTAVRGGIENERVLSGLGMLYLKDNDIDNALSVLKKAFTISSNKDPISANLVVAYLKKGDTQSALGLLESIKNVQSRIPDINQKLGDAFLKNKQGDKALFYYKKQAANNKNTPELQSSIAELSYASQSPLVAKNEYLALIKMGKGGADVLYRLVLLSLRLKDTNAADSYLGEATKSGSADVKMWYEIGNEYLKMDKTSKAINAFEECVRKDPSMATGGIELASLLQKVKKDSAAAEIYLQLYESTTTTANKYLLLSAQLFDKCGALEKAKKAYRKAVDKSAAGPKDVIRLAQIEFDGGNFQNVLALLESLSVEHIGVPEAKLLSESYYAIGKFEKAIPHLTSIQTKLPKDTRAIELSARIRDTLGDYDNAVTLYTKYLSSVGRHADYAFHIGELYEKLKKIPLAIQQYASNIVTYQDDYRNFDRLSRLYITTEKNAEAIPILKRAVSFKKAPSDLNGLLAQALATLGRGQEAILQYEKHLETNKDDYNGWVQLGTLYFSQKKYDSAAEALEKAIDIKKSDPDVLIKLGKSYFETKQYNQAIDNLTRARNIDRNNSEILSLLATCFRVSGTTKNLIETLRALADLDKKSFDTRVELAKLLQKENRTTETIAILEEIVLLQKCQTEFHLQLAELYKQTKNDKQWLMHITAATACSPRDPQLNMELGRYHFDRKEYAEAATYLKMALSVNSKLHEGYYLLGVIVREEKKFSDAKDFFNKAIQIDPSKVEYRVAYAEMLYQEGNAAGALKIIAPIVSQSNLPSSTLRVAGLIYNAAGKVDTAREFFDQAVKSDRSCTECYIALGDLHYENAEFSDAAKNYQQAIDLKSIDEGVHIRFANSLIKIQKFNQARNLLEKIVQVNPKNSEAIYRLCHVYMVNNQLADVRKLMNTSPKNGWYYLTAGELNEIEGKIDAASIAYTSALKTLSGVSEVQAGCGRISLLKKRYTNAIEYLGQAIAGDPENTQHYMDLGKAYDESGDLSTALELYKEVQVRKPDHPEVYYYMGRIYSKNKNHDAAIEILSKGIDKDKKNVDLYMTLGHEYRLIKESKKAIDNYERATKIDKIKALDGFKLIGALYYEMKDEKKAKKYYEMYISAGGRDQNVKTLLKKMQ